MNMSRHLTGVLLCTAMLLLNGCASTGPTRFYLLSPIGGDHAGGCPDGRTLSLGVGPIEVPRYLDRPQIMTRTGPNEMALAEFDLWAEPLKEGIPRILARNLQAQACARVEADAWKRPNRVDYMLVAVINRLDGVLGESAVLDVKWVVTDERNKETVLSKTSTYTENVATRDYRSLAASYSSLVAAFSRDVAESLSSLSSGRGGPEE